MLARTRMMMMELWKKAAELYDPWKEMAELKHSTPSMAFTNSWPR